MNRKQLLLISGMIKISKAGGAIIGSSLSSPVTRLVELMYLPASASAGTCSVTLKVHDDAGAREPPVKVRTPVPLIWEPAPQTSFIGRPSWAGPIGF